MDVAEADELYGLPLREFVPARDALAKRLRAEGRRDDAAAVRALRRPSAAAWVVNQLMRTQRRAAAELFAAGDALLDTQAAVVAGERPASELRTATTRQRHAVDALRVQAAGLLDERGHAPSAQTLERVADTLHAISLDTTLRGPAAAGRLLDSYSYAGLGTLGIGKVAQRPAAAPAPPAERPARDPAEQAARRRAAASAKRAAEKASARRVAAQERRDAAASELAQAEARTEAARSALVGAESALDRARREEEQAAAELERARAELD